MKPPGNGTVQVTPFLLIFPPPPKINLQNQRRSYVGHQDGLGGDRGEAEAPKLRSQLHFLCHDKLPA